MMIHITATFDDKRQKSIIIDKIIKTETYSTEGYLIPELSREYKKEPETLKQIESYLKMTFDFDKITCFIDGNKIDFRKVLIF